MAPKSMSYVVENIELKGKEKITRTICPDKLSGSL